MAQWFEGFEAQTGNLDLNNLGVDQAYLNITSDTPFHLYELSDECIQCPFVHNQHHYNISETFITKVSTRYSLTWRIYDSFVGPTVSYEDERHLCEIRFRDFSEFAVYEISVSDRKCESSIASPPVNIYYPLILIAAGLLTLTFIYVIGSSFKNKWKHRKETWQNDCPARKSSRISALDSFRGFCLLSMIFINDGAGSYAFLDHATWNGIHFADLLFPWFLWIMGVCIPVSIRSQLKKTRSRLSIFGSIVQRSCLLFLLGLVFNTITGSTSIDKIRIFGVLQRLAVAYFVVAALTTFLMINRSHSDHGISSGSCTDVINLVVIWFLMIALVLTHYHLTFHFKIPGCPPGYLGPGGIHLNGLYKNCTGGFSGYIDRLMLTSDHLFRSHVVVEVYEALPIDPEGPFGCLLSSFQAFLGAQAGSTALCFPGFWARVKRWLSWGLALGVIGVLLCQGRQEGGWVPLNKTIWSLSYVLVTSSLAFFILAFLHYIIDAQKIWNGAPFHHAGMNSIVLYMGHGLCYRVFPFHWTYLSMNTHLMLTIEALWGTCLWMIVAFFLYKNKLFLSL